MEMAQARDSVVTPHGGGHGGLWREQVSERRWRMMTA